MSMFFLNSDVVIYRNRSQGNNKYSMSATFTAYQADIQPVSGTREDSGVGRVSKSFVCYMDANVEIKEGDQIMSAGKRYGVRSVITWNNAGLLDHKEIQLESKDG